MIKFNKLFEFDLFKKKRITIIIDESVINIDVTSKTQMYEVYDLNDYSLSCIAHETEDYYIFIDILSRNSKYFFKAMFVLSKN